MSTDQPASPALQKGAFPLKRRSFMQLLGAGLLLAVSAVPGLAQRKGGGGTGRGEKISARLHLGRDGSITVLTGKVEGGQGARAELSMAAAEELRVPVEKIQLIMADTSLVPDDGITAGSRSTPSTVPAVRRGAAAARELLVEFAARKWGAERKSITVRDGLALAPAIKQGLSYADLAKSEQFSEAIEKAIPNDVTLIPVTEWKVFGHSTPRPNAKEIVTGKHQFPSDMSLPGMLYGKVLRPPAYGAKLTHVDVTAAREFKDVIVVRDGDFIGVAAPTSFLARKALQALESTAKWEFGSHPSSKTVYAYLKERAQGGIPANPFGGELGGAKTVLKETFYTAYVQHAPLEPRAALAEWKDGKLTVWGGTQSPFGWRGELARAFGLRNEDVRVIVPDFGSGFGGKHTGECGVEAARLAKGARRPVKLCWTRREEFTAAYFRPAAVIQIEAGLDGQGRLSSWHFVNVNSGGAALETPYRSGKSRCQFVGSQSPLRQGSYRALASTANNFARESFMDELAAAAGMDPLEFRLTHLEEQRPETTRLRAVLETAAERFGWKGRIGKRTPNVGIGLACGTEKASYVAACVEVEVDAQKQIHVRKICQVFECGAVLNPDNLLAQVQGAVIMGLGPVLREEMVFENGEMLNGSFRQYKVPRFLDVPELDLHLLNRPDLDAVGGGETPIIAVAPAIANAVFHATGMRLRSLPLKLPV